jgi:nitrite reductase/ring-hydroxylating ferredoxin subunit
MRAASNFAQENLNVAAQYTEWLTPGEVKSVEEIAPSSGAVLRRGLTKSAVYRDEQGGLHERSAVCPHLSCIVGWNAGEQTWDCPCHGSRFDKFGAVINGPAISDLAMVESEPRPAAESYTSKAGKMPRRPSDHHIVQRGGGMEITRENQFGTQTGASTNPLQRAGSPSTEGKMDRAAAVAGEKLEAAAGMIREKAPQEGTLGNTATAVAERLEGMGYYLQNQGLSGAMEDLEGLIRRYPIQSLLLGVGLGYLLSRIKER